MRFIVVVNDVEISREWPWSRIYQVKEELKKLGFRWTGGGWVGRARDLSVLYSLRSLLELSQEEFEAVLKAASPHSGGAVLISGQLPDKLKPCVLSSYGDTHLVSINKFIREFIVTDKQYIGLIKSYEDYINKALDEFRSAIKGLEVHGDLGEALRAAYEFAAASSSLKSLYERRTCWRTAELWPTHAVLNFMGKNLSAELNSLKIAYNIVGKEGEVRQSFIKLAKIAKIDNNKIIIKFPIFIKNKISEILKKYGYIINEKKVEYKRVEFKPSLSLHEFQRAAVESWMRAGMRGTIAVATGGGKTFIAMDAMARASTTALVLVVTKELARQWASRLRRHLGISAGLLGGGEHEVRDVTVAIYNSAVKYIDELMGKFGLVVFDEAHHVPAETFKEVALNLDSPYRLALSATPNREDGNEHLIFEAVGPLVFRASYGDMVRAGLVVPIEHYRIYLRMRPEEEQAYKSAQARADNAIVLRNIAAQSSAKVPVAAEVVAREIKLNGRVLVFTQFIEQARAVYEKLREMGIPAELITSEERDREAAFNRFASGLVKAVVTTTVLDEGVDVPDADVAVVVSGSGSMRQMIQRVGRVVRKAPGKDRAKVYEIITRNTIEEALSESRHIDKVIEEIICKKFTEISFKEFVSRRELTEFSRF